MTNAIDLMMQDNQQALDIAAQQLLISELLNMDQVQLKTRLSEMATDTPVICLGVGSNLLKRLGELPEHFASDRRQLVLYACKRSMVNLESMTRQSGQPMQQ